MWYGGEKQARGRKRKRKEPMQIQRNPARSYFEHPDVVKNLSVVPVETARTLNRILLPPTLIEGMIPQGAIVLVSGETHSGKTFFAMELAKSLAEGSKFMGEFNVPSLGNTLFIEQDAPRVDTGKAFWAMLNKRWHDEIGDPAGLDGPLDSLYFAWHQGFDLLNGESSSRIIQTANSLHCFLGWGTEATIEYEYDETGEVIARHEIPPGEVTLNGVKLIVLDTFRSLHTAEENDSGQMEAVMQDIKFIRARTGATIILIHHDNASGERSRGSTAIEAACDQIFRLTRKRGSSIINCRVTKSRIIQASPFRFTIDSYVDDEIGEVKEVKFVDFMEKQEETKQNNLESFLAYLMQSSEDGVSRTDLLEWGGFNKISQRTLDRYIKQLKTNNRLRTEDGPNNTVKYFGLPA